MSETIGISIEISIEPLVAGTMNGRRTEVAGLFSVIAKECDF